LYSGTPLSDYAPANTDEADIQSLLLRYQNAKNEHNVDGFLSCFTAGGRFMYSGHLMVTRDELKVLLPKYWANLRSGDLMVRPMCRENLNGNLFNGRLFDPIITVDQDTDTVCATFVSSKVRWRTLLFLDLLNIDGRWYIDRLRWDMG
jgi:hypothetical protein